MTIKAYRLNGTLHAGRPTAYGEVFYVGGRIIHSNQTDYVLSDGVSIFVLGALEFNHLAVPDPASDSLVTSLLNDAIVLHGGFELPTPNFTAVHASAGTVVFAWSKHPVGVSYRLRDQSGALIAETSDLTVTLAVPPGAYSIVAVSPLGSLTKPASVVLV